MKENSPNLIFLIDDDKAILNVFEYSLSQGNGWEINTFNTPEELLENMNQNPKVVVLDYMLNSNLTGMDVLKKIRETDKEIKVIVLSSNNEQKVIDEFYELGADKYIVKESFFVDAIRSEISKFVTEFDS